MKLTTRRQIYGGEPEPMDMQPIDPSRPMAPTLTAEQWEVVLRHLDLGQHRIVRPIIDSLMQQLQHQAQPQFTTADEP